MDSGRTTMLTPELVHKILDIMEPIQVGYGAVILSFLGAIHWGFEWAQLGGRNGMYRYLPGILAPAVAWPTLFLPFETALLAQFGAFGILYFFDASASEKGTAPAWYGNYRWLLTFVIGISVFVTIWNREMLILHGYHSACEASGEQLVETAREATRQMLHSDDASGEETGKRNETDAAAQTTVLSKLSEKAPSAVHYKESREDRKQHRKSTS
ncbi:hypothetical protein KEM52_005875 [Ascosphaera acerosa]|nr:hypothetical protein KEM52_005875 [Ascosphaera acerosa]